MSWTASCSTPAALPGEASISAVAVAELTVGPLFASDPSERARRQARLQAVEATFEPLPFGAAEARSFGLVVAAATASARSHRSRFADLLLVAATAHANSLPLYTRNADDFDGLDGLVEVVAI